MRRVLMLSIIVIALSACGEKEASNSSNEDDVTNKVEQTNDERQAEIASMEKEISGAVKTERTAVLDAKADRLLKRYRDYVGINPRDSMTSEYLFRAADLSVGMGQYDAAIAYIDWLH